MSLVVFPEMLGGRVPLLSCCLTAGLRVERQNSLPGLLLVFFSVDHLSCLCKSVVFLTVSLLREGMAFYLLAMMIRFLNSSAIYNSFSALHITSEQMLLFVLPELW